MTEDDNTKIETEDVVDAITREHAAERHWLRRILWLGATAAALAALWAAAVFFWN